MTTKDEVARRVAERLGLEVEPDELINCPPDYYISEVWDALISSEMRVAELQEALRLLVDECTTCGSPSLGLIDKAEAALEKVK